jgi:uncharacterized protein
MRISTPVAIEAVPPVLWKNGGGTTRTLVVEPAEAPLGDFLWRLSLARIEAPGPFSAFAGIDRTILLWRGDGVVLRSEAWPEQRLVDPLRPFCFRGEDAVTCQLLGGSTTDLNLMVRRGAVSASMRSYATEVRLSGPYDEVIVLCAAGDVDVLAGHAAPCRLETDYFLRVERVQGVMSIVPQSAEARFVCVLVKRQGIAVQQEPCR